MERSLLEWGTPFVVKSPDICTEVCKEAKTVELSTTGSYVNCSGTIMARSVGIAPVIKNTSVKKYQSLKITENLDILIDNFEYSVLLNSTMPFLQVSGVDQTF